MCKSFHFLKWDNFMNLNQREIEEKSEVTDLRGLGFKAKG